MTEQMHRWLDEAIELFNRGEYEDAARLYRLVMRECEIRASWLEWKKGKVA